MHGLDSAWHTIGTMAVEVLSELVDVHPACCERTERPDKKPAGQSRRNTREEATAAEHMSITLESALSSIHSTCAYDNFQLVPLHPSV